MSLAAIVDFKLNPLSFPSNLRGVAVYEHFDPSHVAALNRNQKEQGVDNLVGGASAAQMDVGIVDLTNSSTCSSLTPGLCCNRELGQFPD